MVDKDEIRGKIIITSGQIFSSNGFRRTTVEDIAAALKMGKRSRYDPLTLLRRSVLSA